MAGTFFWDDKKIAAKGNSSKTLFTVHLTEEKHRNFTESDVQKKRLSETIDCFIYAIGDVAERLRRLSHNLLSGVQVFYIRTGHAVVRITYRCYLRY